jgi:hypothetical protein
MFVSQSVRNNRILPLPALSRFSFRNSRATKVPLQLLFQADSSPTWLCLMWVQREPNESQICLRLLQFVGNQMELDPKGRSSPMTSECIEHPSLWVEACVLVTCSTTTLQLSTLSKIYMSLCSILKHFVNIQNVIIFWIWDSSVGNGRSGFDSW